MGTRTDLAMEAREFRGADRMRGVRCESRDEDGFTVTEVVISDSAGAKLIGKPQGSYITIERSCLADQDVSKRASRLLSGKLFKMLPSEGDVLVAGLGNRDITPDSLGPKAAEKVFVTRHLTSELGIKSIDGIRLRTVSSIAPGVMGVTGIESECVISSIARSIAPACVICVDSLASMRTKRLLSTVQISDSGIAPGSGVGNHRTALDFDSLSVPVIAIGVPTVVYASTIARDAVGNESITLGDDDDMIVTPRNIDEATETLASMIADGINMALQPGLDPSSMRI